MSAKRSQALGRPIKRLAKRGHEKEWVRSSWCRHLLAQTSECIHSHWSLPRIHLYPVLCAREAQKDLAHGQSHYYADENLKLTFISSVSQASWLSSYRMLPDGMAVVE